MKTGLSGLSMIALLAALGTAPAFAHEVYVPGDGEGSDTHWIEHLNDPKPAPAAPRGAEGPIRSESRASYCDPAFEPYYATIGRQTAAETGACAMRDPQPTGPRTGK